MSAPGETPAILEVQRRVAGIIDRLNVALNMNQVGVPVCAQTLHALRHALGRGSGHAEGWIDVDIDEALALVEALLPYVMAAQQ